MSKQDYYAREVFRAGTDLGITPHGIVIGFATVYTECQWWMYANRKVPESFQHPHDRIGDDGYSVGLFQQQIRQGPHGDWWWSDCADCMNPYKSARLFFSHLARLDYTSPAHSPGWYAQQVQKSAYPDRYDQRMAEAQQLYDRIADVPIGGTVAPTFTELDQTSVSPNTSGRGGQKPRYFLLHTQEGNGTALSLAGYLQNPNSGVSYHYTIDNGVTVVDVVDTDLASWSVLDANGYSINLCFAGSRAAWSRQEWLDQMGRGIDVAAFLAVADCRKYGIAANVYGPDRYDALARGGTGISDHRFITSLGIGNHTDVGGGFPWDVFAAAVQKYATGTTEELTVSEAEGIKKYVSDLVIGFLTPVVLDVKACREQLTGSRDEGEFAGFEQLGQNPDGTNKTPVDAIADLRNRVIAIEEKLS